MKHNKIVRRSHGGMLYLYIYCDPLDGLVEVCSNSSTLAVELQQCCPKPSNFFFVSSSVQCLPKPPIDCGMACVVLMHVTMVDMNTACIDSLHVDSMHDVFNVLVHYLLLPLMFDQTDNYAII